MSLLGGYRVIYYDNYEHYGRCKAGTDNPKILHDPKLTQRLSAGKIKQSISSLWTFDLSISTKNNYYSDLKPIVGLVEVINLFDGSREFFGRVLSETGEMAGSGHHIKGYICEDLLGYLHDSTQTYKKFKNDGSRRFLADVIDYHNQQVEPHKRFWVRKVNVDSGSDVPFRYTAYDSTFETIKTYMLERMGGYLVLDYDVSGEMYLDWLESVGSFVDSPIMLGKNLKTAKREFNPDGLITRLVPVGADKDNSTGRDEETGQYVTRERVTIDSVNRGIRYLEDTALVKEFGIIQKSVDWTEISDPNILKKRGQQYLDNQKLAIASWSIDTVELYLIDSRFAKYKVGNTHPIDDPLLAGAEKLQIVEKEIDILYPQKVSLKIGSNSQSLSMYQLQQQEAKKSMQRQAQNEAAARRKAEQQLEATQKEFEKAQGALKAQIDVVAKETNKASLEANLTQNRASLKIEQQNLLGLEAEKQRLESLGTDQSAPLALIEVQINISQTKISNHEALIVEIEQKLKDLEGKDA